MKRLLLTVLSVFFIISGAQAKDAPPEDVYARISSNKELSKFTDLINEAGVKDLLKNKDVQVTVFAPSNSALNDVPSAAWKHAKASKENMQNFVKYYIVTGSRISSSALNGRKFSSGTANGETISFDGTVKGKWKANDATIQATDLSAPNGVVHIISAALIPPSFHEDSKEAFKKEEPGLLKGLFNSGDKDKKEEKAAPVSTTTEAGVTVPVTQPSGTPTETPAATASAPPPPAAAEPPKKKGFTIFGRTFFGGN